MNRILLRGVGIPVALMGLVSCGPAEPEQTPYTLAYTIPTSGTQLSSLSFALGEDVGGGFQIHESPCAADNVSAVDYGGYYLIEPNWDPYECSETPATPAEGQGTLQFFLDGYFFGEYTAAPVTIDLSPKITLVYYDYATSDLNGDGDAANDLYVVCNLYMPDAYPWYMTKIVEQAATDYGGYLDLYSSADPATATLLTGQIDYGVWGLNAQPGWWFDYLGTIIPDIRGDEEDYSFSVWAQLADDTHAAVYGALGERVLFNDFPADALADWPDQTGKKPSEGGIPWCGDVFGYASPLYY